MQPASNFLRTASNFLRTVMILAVVSTLCVASGAKSLHRAAPDKLYAADFSSAFSQEAGGEITKANWRRHSKIRNIRAIVQAVSRGMSRKTLSTKRRVFEYCEPYEDTERVIARDSRGRTRFYKKAGGSEDSSLTWEHYYDEAGHLRFVLITGGAVNGSKLEHRIYLDETGKRIWEDQSYLKGPGYTFPVVWPDDQLEITDPAGKFLSASPCSEINGKPGGPRRSRDDR